MKHLKQVVAVVAVAAAFGSPLPASAGGIPVIDAANLSQSTISAIEEVAQTLKQIEEYKTQLDQYENQLLNTEKPTQEIWDAAEATMSRLMSALGRVNEFKEKFKDLEYYRTLPCFSGGGCSEADLALIQEQNRLSSEAQRKTTDKLMTALEEQQANLSSDAATLKRLQSAASAAEGQMQALGYANQIASQQANQLLQLRALLIAQQNAWASKIQADNDRQSRYDAADEVAHRVSNPNRSRPVKTW